ncbi:O-antigen ligase family protein [Clostridium sp. NSJ-6]|uniref:O-antigen ligase family protein n=1 Tax=Clostridium hominis TaxID=2763036 RepID=A0ABR7DA10_9CLOT|nr:O-antigen ligase family protein [Clostridium hominis]MBC5628047.1 O-antigen ligase family protein [Clostridium hominis]MDU2673190.1 O-antigen ligase family protein [Clostridium sp.]
MKIYQRLVNILLLVYIILYPIIPTTRSFASDIIIYILILLQIIGFIFIKKERDSIFNLIINLFNDKIFFTLILLNLAMYLSTFVATDIRTTVTHSIRFTMYIFIFYCISYKTTAKDHRILFNTFISLATLSGIYTVIQLIYTIHLGYSIDKTIRMSSFLENPNNLAAYSILAFFIVIILLISTKKLAYKLFYGLSSVLLLINIMFSQSRNALIAIVIGAFIIAVLYDKRFIILSFILPVIFLIIPSIRSRVFQIFDMSQNSSRFKIWNIDWLMIKDYPLAGIGYENFSVQYPLYTAKNPNFIVENGYIAIHPHNIFLKIQTELGIIGSILFISFIIATIITLYKLIKSKRNKIYSSITIGVLTSFVTFIFMNLLDCYLNSPKVLATLFVILALANSLRIKINSKIID